MQHQDVIDIQPVGFTAWCGAMWSLVVVVVSTYLLGTGGCGALQAERGSTHTGHRHRHGHWPFLDGLKLL